MSLQHTDRFLPTQVMQRIEGKFSPADDELPFAQARRHHDEMAAAVAAFGKHRRKRQTEKAKPDGS